MKSEVSLMVNGQPISLDGFVKELIDGTVGGILLALEGVNEINDMDLQINGGEVSVAVNGTEVPINSFVSNTIKNTVIGKYGQNTNKEIRRRVSGYKTIRKRRVER